VFSYHDADNRSACFFHLLAKDWVELTGNAAKFNAKLAPSAKARANARRLHATAENVIRVHWINPLKPKPGLTDAHMHEIKALLAIGYPVAAGAEHSRLLVGYRGDPKQPGGGMFIDKDSALGAYAEVTYQFVKTKVGDVFWVEALAQPR
jgi:hypothetical protein